MQTYQAKAMDALDGTLRVRFLYMGRYLIYHCEATPEVFRSANDKLRVFTASNGRLIASKNSPVLTEEVLFLHGAYADYADKPSLLFVETEARYHLLTDAYLKALSELADAIARGDMEARITQEGHPNGQTNRSSTRL